MRWGSCGTGPGAQASRLKLFDFKEGLTPKTQPMIVPGAQSASQGCNSTPEHTQKKSLSPEGALKAAGLGSESTPGQCSRCRPAWQPVLEAKLRRIGTYRLLHVLALWTFEEQPANIYAAQLTVECYRKLPCCCSCNLFIQQEDVG